MSAQGWADILDADEQILWQGRPDPALVFSAETIVAAIFGTFFAGFALFWMVMASNAGGFFWMFGLIHFAVGLSIVVGAFLKKPFQYRRTWYSLSNKRAFIATHYPLQGKRLHSYVIDADTALSMDEGPLSDIQFATATTTSTRKGHTRKARTRTRRIGFDRLADGAHVYRLMRDIQRRARQKVPA